VAPVAASVPAATPSATPGHSHSTSISGPPLPGLAPVPTPPALFTSAAGSASSSSSSSSRRHRVEPSSSCDYSAVALFISNNISKFATGVTDLPRLSIAGLARGVFYNAQRSRLDKHDGKAWVPLHTWTSAQAEVMSSLPSHGLYWEGG